MLMVPYFKDTIYDQGINVYTTIRSRDQLIASNTVRQNMIEYDRRYGYRGVEGYADLSHPDTETLISAWLCPKSSQAPIYCPEW